jgi:hypothetical protein
MISADGPHAGRGRTAEVHRILLAACRIRVEAYVEEVKGDPRRSPRTRSHGMTEYLISVSLSSLAGDRVGLGPAPSLTAKQEGN